MAAELVVSSFLSVAIDKLASAALESIARSKQIHSDLQKWKTSLPQIQALLNDASKKEITHGESVQMWLNRLKHVAYDMEDVLEDLESRTITSTVRKLISTTCCTSSCFPINTGLHRKVEDITCRLQLLENETNNFGFIEKHEEPITVKRMYETSLPDASRIVGRDHDKKKLVDKLLVDKASDKNFSIVPIVGIGGLGKTTLARLLYNEPKVMDHFELKAWVCVSDDFHIFNISQVIFTSVTGENKEFKDLNQLQDALRKQVMGKRFLLVLDDVWSESRDEWDNLVKPFHDVARGSKIIITTRKQTLLNELHHNDRNLLEALSPVDALSVFALHALDVDNFDSHPRLKPYGEAMVSKCGCLPLALKALGRSLSTDEEKWKEVSNSKIWESGNEDKVFQALRLSYLDLSVCLKRLFAYCSLFPKDYLFDKNQLVPLWMAEGFLHQSTSSLSIESWGHLCFEELLFRSFFQPAPNEESLYVMHDLMNDLATSVAGDFFLRVDIGKKEELRSDVLEKCRHMSFVCEDYITREKFQAMKGAKNVRSFLALYLDVKEIWPLFYLSNKILGDLLHELPLLRVLSLSNLSISEVPESVGNLKHLRYLNLSCTPIRCLPEHVCSLYHLQTLIVSSCHCLTELPIRFLKLKNLQHFDIRNTSLFNKIPVGIGELKNMKILASEIIIEEHKVFGVTGLHKLMDLQGKLVIEGLENVKNPVHAEEANFSQKRLSELELRWRDVSDGFGMEMVEKEVLDKLKPCNDSLKTLSIVHYGGIEFPKWVGDPSFLQLADLRLEGCRKCTSLPPLRHLPSLKKLFIGGMDRVKAVDLELSTNTKIPCLEELCIEFCPDLVEVLVGVLPSLKDLQVRGCSHGVLTSLVRAASSSLLTRLAIYNISGLTNEVWGGVMLHLGAVEQVQIRSCNDIRYLWESEAEASKVLMKLRKLEIRECLKLVRLGEKEDNSVSGSNLLLLLTHLEIWNCENIERCSCPNSINTLKIHNCDSITSVSFPTGGGQKLNWLSIGDCKKLVLEKDITLLINNTSNATLPSLESLSIGMIEKLESMVELRSFIHLTSLRIYSCRNMKSFPDHELQNLTELRHLAITNCPNMDASFPRRGLWPPKLHSLGIGGLKKPISEWGPQNFPNSLVDLTLYGGWSEGGGGDGVRSWSASLSSHLLPSSLTSLTITGFGKLKSLSEGFQHLTSLQGLDIIECPKMKHLPETTLLLPSLLELTIISCPILKERCKGRGSYYWSLISHIPRIQFF